jgi:dTDP-4-amino-4,6-dideoxygalactose transaminase
MENKVSSAAILIPFLDLVTPHFELEEELLSAVRSVLLSGRFVGGPEVELFEKEFAEFCSAEQCIGVGSGTDALRFALIAVGVKRGDVVITVPNTFIATTEAISQAGADIAFIDTDENTGNMSAEHLRKFLESHHSKSVKAIIPVHLYGQMADMDPILDLASKYNLIVIEDACQAHGAEYFSRKYNRWFRAGSMGMAAAFSFYPGKNLGACGEAGAVTTNDRNVARQVRLLRDHGQTEKYCHEREGYNGRLDSIQAAMLRIKLRHLPAWNERRRNIAALYHRLLSTINGVLVPSEPTWSRAVYHLYVIRIPDRDVYQRYLSAQGIGTGLHYPSPLHLLPAYKHLGYCRGSFPTAERAAGEILSLPMFPTLTEFQQRQIASVLRQSTSQVGRTDDDL